MKNKILVELNLEEYDYENSKITNFENIYIRQFEYDGNVSNVTDNFYPALGEGILISSDISNNYYLFNIKLIGTRNLDIFNKLLENFTEVEVTQDEFYLNFLNLETEKFIQLEDEEILSFDKIQEYLVSKGIEFKVIENKIIYEKGASGLFEGILIGLSANIATEVLKEIYNYIKALSTKKLYENEVSEKVKQRIFQEYNLKYSQLYLSKIEKKQDNFQYTFRTKKRKIFVEIDNKGEIIELTSTKK